MKKLLFALILLMTPPCVLSGNASTFYVRPDGGDTTQCNGLYDAPNPDFSGQKNCALKHPAYVLAPNGSNPTLLKGGDTLIIDGTNTAQYMIGLGMPNSSDTSKCSPNWPWDCFLRSVPSGTASQPTRILGKGWDTGCSAPPQLWGNERPPQIINLVGSNNIELQCLELTDHSSCIESGPSACQRNTYPYGEWSPRGIYASDSSNVLLKNMNIHGFAHAGIHAGRLNNWTLNTVKIVGNAWVGWDGDIGANVSSNSGNMNFIKTRIEYSGCGETYPGKQPHDCFSQSQGGYGDGLGTHNTGGNWLFDDCDISHNVSDGLDLLYHNGSGTITIQNSRFEGNAGNQIKTATTSNITNTYVDGNCAYFKGKSFTYTGSPGFDHCRAMGNALGLAYKSGTKVTTKNLTVEHAVGDCILLTGANNCSNGEYLKINDSKFSADAEYWGEQVCFFYNDGSCSLPVQAANYSVYNTKGGCPSGATCVPISSAPSTWGYQGTVIIPPPVCIPDGSCNAVAPACGQTTTGANNCGNSCTKTGATCPPVCVSDGSCSALIPACGTITTGIDNCGTACTKVGAACPITSVTITMTTFRNNTSKYTTLINNGTRVFITYNNKTYELIIKP